MDSLCLTLPCLLLLRGCIPVMGLPVTKKSFYMPASDSPLLAQPRLCHLLLDLSPVSKKLLSLLLLDGSIIPRVILLLDTKGTIIFISFNWFDAALKNIQGSALLFAFAAFLIAFFAK